MTYFIRVRLIITGEASGFQVDKLRPRCASSKSLEDAELEPKSIILRNPLQSKRAICPLRKSGQAEVKLGPGTAARQNPPWAREDKASGSPSRG